MGRAGREGHQEAGLGFEDVIMDLAARVPMKVIDHFPDRVRVQRFAGSEVAAIVAG
jgi:hypothetical protein